VQGFRSSPSLERKKLTSVELYILRNYPSKARKKDFLRKTELKEFFANRPAFPEMLTTLQREGK
jgi:hypothetical protein